MSDKELKPCPFCGGEAKIENRGKYGYGIVCISCGAKSPDFQTETNSIISWNEYANDLLKTEQIKPEISLDGIHPDLINGLIGAKRNSSEIPNSSIGEKIIDAIIENKLFSVINPRTNKEIKETLIVWSSMTDEILEAVVAEEICKQHKTEEE